MEDQQSAMIEEIIEAHRSIFRAIGASAPSVWMELDLSTFDAKNSYLYRLARLLMDLEEAQPDVSREARRKARSELASIGQTLTSIAAVHGAILRVYHRAVRSIARNYGPFRGFVWKLIRWMNPPRKSR